MHAFNIYKVHFYVSDANQIYYLTLCGATVKLVK